MLCPVVTGPKVIESAPHPSASYEENQAVVRALDAKIKYLFEANAHQGIDAVARVLQPLFTAAQDSPDKIETLVQLAAQSGVYVPIFTAAVLEKIEWHHEKEQMFSECLGSMIASRYIAWQHTSINSCTNKSNSFPAHNLVIVTKSIFGCGDFTADPIAIPDSLARAIALSIRLAAADLQKKKANGEIYKETPIGFKVVIGQYVECRFPASLISPVLPYLTHIPGLLGLELSDVGVRNPWDDKKSKETGNGFADEDADALLALFRTNPYLRDVQICVDGMSEEKKVDFMRQWQEIWEENVCEPSSLKDLLSLPSKENY